MGRPGPLLVAALAAGLAYLWIPILAMVLASFNDSRLQAAWGGFSLRWYAELFADREIQRAALLSVRIAAISATLATVIGAAAALALARHARGSARGLLGFATAAPLVTPEVVLGFASLLLFIALEAATGWPARRGFATITLVQATLAVAYVTVLVRARAASLPRDVEEAAADLGARPFEVLRDVTLPMLAPALAAGWLMAFTLSIDDLVLASFTTGPGSTTLPIFVWSKVRFGVTPQVNALATLMIAFVALVTLIASLVALRTRSPAA